MDEAYVARFTERSAYETARTGPPDGFPKLPDLPLSRYTDPEFYALERDHLWKRSWLYAAHDSELADVGSYKLCDIAGALRCCWCEATTRWCAPSSTPAVIAALLWFRDS